ncbi:MAG: type II secretion system F family protein [Acidimicrobiia bacterium]|nr:type II secretion system F family protein [Acidimicrobiia bacterium]
MTLLVFGFFAAVMALVAGVGYAWMRIKPEAVAPSAAARPDSPTTAWVQVTLVEIGRRVSRPGKTDEPLRKQLFRAGYRKPSAPLIFRGVQVSIGLTLATLLGWAGGMRGDGFSDALLALVCGAGIGYMLPSRLVEFQVKARANRVRRAVPAALDLLVLALEAGQSLDQAMRDTASSLRSLYPELSAELSLCYLEMGAGTSRSEALRRLGERSGEDEMIRLAALLIDGERFGTSLGPALRTHARYLRTRMRQKAQESARKLGVKLVIPVFFLIFPSVLLVTLGPAYLQLRGFFDSFLN